MGACGYEEDTQGFEMGCKRKKKRAVAFWKAEHSSVKGL